MAIVLWERIVVGDVCGDMLLFRMELTFFYVLYLVEKTADLTTYLQ